MTATPRSVLGTLEVNVHRDVTGWGLGWGCCRAPPPTAVPAGKSCKEARRGEDLRFCVSQESFFPAAHPRPFLRRQSWGNPLFTRWAWGLGEGNVVVCFFGEGVRSSASGALRRQEEVT